MPRDSDKKVTIYVVNTVEDEDEEEDDDEEDIIQEEDDHSDDSDDDSIFIQKDHQTRSKVKIPLEKIPKIEKIPVSKRFHINKGHPITNLKSLIQAFDHPKADDKQKELVEHLKDLDCMIGMDKFKEQIINQILFFVQDMHDPQTFLHTVITGPPGVGKTRLIGLLAKIYCKLGILGTDNVVKADRASLIGKWCGHTAIKTKQVLESAKGGVLILDEVYSLGNKEQGDSFSKECIDTLNQYLSEHVDDFVCVIAGYKDLVQECFFAANPGLERRFPWRFGIDPYTPDELTQIFKVQLNECGWKLETDVTDKFITDLIRMNKDCFSGNGGDTRNLIDRCKIINARRVFTMVEEEEEIPAKKKRRGKFSIPPTAVVEKTKTISKTDLDSGIKVFADSKKETKNEIPEFVKSLYL